MKNRNNIIVILALTVITNAVTVWAGQSSTEPAGEKMSYLDNGTIRLGMDLNIGGSIIYLADSDNRINIINNHDWGRQIHPDRQYHTYEIDLSSSPDYKGAITGLRLDPVSTVHNGEYIKIEYISWRKKPK